MTEDEAKTKWCPFARVSYGKYSCNRSDHDSPVGKCIGSKCMAWREYKHSIPSFDEFGKNMEPLKYEGYCGLAGKP